MRILLLLAALVSLNNAAGAQASLPELPSGTRVRIRAPSAVEKNIVGTIAAYGGDSLTITRGKANRNLTLHLDDIASIDRSRGRDHALGAVIGAAGGAIVGVILGVVCVSVCPKKNSSDANLAPIGGFVIGVPAGAVLGALVGLERWQRVKVR